MVPDRRQRRRDEGERAWSHLTLLAETTAGYHNLVKLCTLGYLEGYYYKPRVDYELLERYADGLICLSGCMAGVTCQALLRATSRRARRARSARVDLRRGGRVRRAAGRRHARARRDQPGAPAHRGRRGPARRRHGRRALPARRGRRPARRVALHPDERAAGRPEPLPLRDLGVLSQDSGRDARADGALGRQPVGADARDRRALQRRARARHAPPAALRRGQRGQLRHAPAALRGGARTTLRAHRRRDPRAARVRAADDRRDGLRRLLPDRLGLRPFRQENGVTSAPAAARRPARSSPTACRSPTSTRSRTTCCSSAS